MGTRKIVTPIFRASYVSLLEPKETQNGGWCYEITMIFDAEDNLDDLKALFVEAVQERWKGNPPKTGVGSPFRRGEWKSESYPAGFDLDKYPEYEGKVVVAARSYTKKLTNGAFDLSKQPGIVGPDGKGILDYQRQPLYSGMFGRAEISMYVPQKGEPRVAVGLHNFQKCYDGESLGGSNGDPEKAFEAFAQPDGAAAGNNADLLGVDMGI